MPSYTANLLISLWLTAASTLLLCGFVWWVDRSRRLNQIYALFCMTIVIWGGFSGGVLLVKDEPSAMVLLRFQYIGIIFLPVLFSHYILLLLERSAPRFLHVNYGVACFFTLLLGTPLLLKGTDTQPTYGFLVEEPGPLYGAMLLWFFIPVVYGFFHLWSAYRHSTGARKNQLKYAFWGALIGFVGGCGNYLYVFRIELPWFNPNCTYAVPLYMGMTAYAILRHRLMDINVVLKKTLIYTLLYSICLAVFGFLVFFLGQWAFFGKIDRRLVLLSMLGLVLVVAMVRPLDRFLTRLTDRVLFRERYRYQQTLKAASAGMGRVRSLPKLLTLIARVIVSNVKVTHATVFLKDRDRPRFVVVASRGTLKKPAGLLRLDEGSPLVAWLSRRRELVVYEELRLELRREQHNSRSLQAKQMAGVVEEMERLQVFVCVPSFMDEKLKGFLMLGEKLSGDMYSQEDLDIFSTLANQAALAIENAQAYEELRDTRDQLLQSERLATIGKFAADMAHEIKNPLQAIMTFFEFLPEKHNDPDFRERFAAVAKSEAQRIDHLVRELVTYTNPKPPQLRPVDIHQVIDSVLALLENDLEKNRIGVGKRYASGSFTVEADRDQMKQVFLNLFMNAVDAMSAGDKKENRLEIATERASSALLIRIHDTGCGIPAHQLPILFAPFFTTKEKGSGLGLSIVQNILKAHRAAIGVDSGIGAGTTVTLTFQKLSI